MRGGLGCTLRRARASSPAQATPAPVLQGPPYPLSCPAYEALGWYAINALHTWVCDTTRSHRRSSHTWVCDTTRSHRRQSLTWVCDTTRSHRRSSLTWVCNGTELRLPVQHQGVAGRERRVWVALGGGGVVAQASACIRAFQAAYNAGRWQKKMGKRGGVGTKQQQACGAGVLQGRLMGVSPHADMQRRGFA